MNSYYEEWGFVTNPFQPTALDPSKEGRQLLVGRGKEIRKVYNRLMSNSGIVTIEGENGIGKTSLINVVNYVLFDQSKNDPQKPLYIPCKKHFQLSMDSNIDEFVQEVYYSVAQTLLQLRDKEKSLSTRLKGHGRIDYWLSDSEINSYGGTVLGVGGSESRSLNNSEGYVKSGFQKDVENWLEKIFPSIDSGGVICMIDNLELLKSSDKAMYLLESLRDKLFNVKGLKWIFCGSHGIIPTIASSTRLSGFLQKPIPIEKLKSTYVTSILEARVSTFRDLKKEEVYTPIEVSDFVILYDSLGGNLRETMKKLDDYCIHIFENDKRPYFPTEKNDEFTKWVYSEKAYTFNELNRTVTKEGFKLLKALANQERIRHLSKMKFQKSTSIKKLINDLVYSGLVTIPIHDLEVFDEMGENLDFTQKYEEESDIRIDDGLSRCIENVYISPKGKFILDLIKL